MAGATPTRDRTLSERADRTLRYGAVLFAAGYLAHSVDHVVRGLDLTPKPTFWLGTIGLVPAAVCVILVFRRHPLAPALSVLSGFFAAIVGAGIHLPAEWSPLSQPWREGVGALDWLSLGLFFGGGLALGLAGLYALLRQRGGGRRTEELAFRTAR